MNSKISFLLPACFIALWAIVPNSVAVNYPDTIHVPVTFYDFHSDRSNPEFEQRHFGQLRTGMVAGKLGEDDKPVIGTSPYMNYYIKNWFKPWQKGDFTIPLYDPKAALEEGFYEYDTALKVDGWQKEYQQIVEYTGIDTVDYDTAFRNIVINDSLSFVHIGNGVYKYESAEFFPLDKRGFGNEWNHELGKPNNKTNCDHNYSFTMELHYQFVKVPGMNFEFCGDDDVWVYLNKDLQIDLGGIHEAQQQSFSVDNISGLQNGRVYDLDLFYAERHSDASHIRITTNIIFSRSNLHIYKNPGTPDVEDNLPLGKSDSVKIGEAATYYGHVFDSLGVWQPKYDSLIVWFLSDSSNATISSQKGSAVTVTVNGTSAVTLSGRFKNPDDTTLPESEVKLILYPKKEKEDTVPPVDTPAVAKSLRIYHYEGTPDIGANSAITKTDTITINEPIKYYGHLFDNDGKWLSEYDSLISWKISSSSDASISSTKGDNTTVTAQKANVSLTLTAKFVNSDNPLQSPVEASITIVTVNAATAKAYTLKLYGKDGTPDKDGNNALGSLVTIKAGDSLPVYGRLFDSTGKWVSDLEENIKWTFEKAVDGASFSPSEGYKTIVTATEVGSSITLKASFKDPSNAGRPSSNATLAISVIAGDPARIEIISDSLPQNTNGNDDFNSIVFERGNASRTVYAILRDKFGNYVGPAKNAVWASNDELIVKVSDANVGRSTVVSKTSSSDGSITFITATYNNLSDSLDVSSIGTTSVAATPNPFIPGVSEIPEIFHENYSNVFNIGDKGVLIGIETPYPLVKVKGESYGTVIVYDCVGNIVRSDLELRTGVKLSGGKTTKVYGVYWNGTNNNGRYTFGTYYWAIKGKMLDNNDNLRPFVANMKVGCRSR